MRKTLAVAKRILIQFKHDKRTLLLLFVAPIIVLWLLSVLLGDNCYQPNIATVDLPKDYLKILKEQDATIKKMSLDDAMGKIKSGDMDAILYLNENSTTLNTFYEGSNTSHNSAVKKIVSDTTTAYNKECRKEIEQDINDKMTTLHLPIEMNINIDEYLPIQDIKNSYLHGNDSWDLFDFYGPVFIGLFIFVFTFLTSGMSLVNEKSAGTMARFLATPIHPFQILGGYAIGFGLFAVVQVFAIVTIALRLIGFPNEGNIAYVVLIAVSMAIASVTFGLLVSGLAKSAFQVIQLMLLFVVPQILLCGIFDLSGAPKWLQYLANVLPVTYGVDAMREVMIKGSGFGDISNDLFVLWAFIIAFFVLASLGFRKKRAKKICTQ